MLATFTREATSADEIADYARAGTYIRGLEGRPSTVVFLFPRRMGGEVTRIEYLGAIPVVVAPNRHVFGTRQAYAVSVILWGHGPSAAAFGTFIDGRAWLVAGEIDNLALSEPFAAHARNPETLVPL